MTVGTIIRCGHERKLDLRESARRPRFPEPKHVEECDIMLVGESIQERVMVFFDLKNVHAAFIMRDRRRDGWATDYVEMVRQIVGPRRLVAAYAFDILRRHDNDYLEGFQLVQALRYQGFRVFAPGDKPEELVQQKEVDVALATELIMQAVNESYDTAVVIAGDRDYVPAILAVQRLGKRVEVAAMAGTFNDRLVAAVDRFHLLDELPFLHAREAEI